MRSVDHMLVRSDGNRSGQWHYRYARRHFRTTGALRQWLANWALDYRTEREEYDEGLRAMWAREEERFDAEHPRTS